MKTKRLIAFILSALMLVPCILSACTGESDVTTAPNDNTSQPSSDATTDEETTTALDVTTDEATTGENTEMKEPPKSIKILAIGNSFSTDSMQYLYEILKDGGVEDVVLGNLYYGGCSLDQHYTFNVKNSAGYKYYKNTTGSWTLTENYKMSDALANEKWDYVSLQQTSKTCGLADSYGRLDELISAVKKACPDAKLIWNMTWAYQQDSTHTSFPNYNNDQMTMYNMIIDVVKTVIEPKNFDVVIPCMTSVQNARTSFLGDTLTRDGYHLDYYIGRYIAGLTWYAAITGCSVDGITYNPSTTKITADMLNVAKEAVTNAIKNPLAVTESAIKTGERPSDDAPIEDPSIKLNPEDFFEADTVLAASNSIDLSKYELLDWNYLENTYWNCTSKPGTTTPASTAGTYHQNICTDRKYSLTELPHGTIFILDDGWQYRLELYTEENAKYTGTRPGMSTNRFFVLDAATTKDANFIAWNIASNPKTDISQIYAQAYCHLRVYVPKN
ncbi:MAG: DUF4886 domain-containing protein [Eubacteriales bacterium]